jgi:sodium-dependent dicarboxylate transporter 2/3/5
LGRDIILLFLGGFLLSAAVIKHGIDSAIARKVLRPFTRSPLCLLYGVLGMSAFFSMWMSNTATATMMIAIVNPFVRMLPEEERFRYALILAVPFGANIGGIGTPIGTPPNAIAYGALNTAGYHITFLKWMLVAVPLELLLLAGVGLLLYLFCTPRPGLQIGMIPIADKPISGQGKATLLILGGTVVLWLTSDQHGLQPGAVALLTAATLTALRVLDRHDVSAIDWDIIILMWGGLSLGITMQESGLMRYIGQANLASLPGGTWTVPLVITFVAVGMSTVMSHTATAALVVPMAMALSLPGKEQFAMLAALACSFAMALPVSTPPNAIAYATGQIPLPVMRRLGSLISLCAAVIMLLGYRLMFPLIFR